MAVAEVMASAGITPPGGVSSAEIASSAEIGRIDGVSCEQNPVARDSTKKCKEELGEDEESDDEPESDVDDSSQSQRSENG